MTPSRQSGGQTIGRQWFVGQMDVALALVQSGFHALAAQSVKKSKEELESHWGGESVYDNFDPDEDPEFVRAIGRMNAILDLE